MHRIAIRGAVLVAAVLSTVSVHAQDRTANAAPRAPKPQQGVLQIGEITIVGRVQKPVAAVDVAKIQPKLTLAELRQPFLDRIEAAVHNDPF
ncbi:MAG: hypothetical protein ABSF69_26300 [Polyangiaceae bacterium]|jgi:hypothetical protein